jgi:serine phosphatase RsbU (regulator of sigma subunit)
VPLVTRVAPGAPADDARFARSLAVRSLEAFEALIADTVPGPAHPGVRSVLCVPLAAADGRPLGAVLLDTRDRGRPFTAADLRLATAVASLAGVALEKARMHEAVRAREKELRDLAVAQDVQKQFLPKFPPTLPGYEFFAHYQTAHKVGGDYYDFITLQDGRLAIVVADVSGKGVPAALLVAQAQLGRAHLPARTSDLAKAVCALNRQLTDGPLGDEHYVTLVAMVLDRARHALTVVSAGHPSPKRHRAAAGALTDLLATDAGGPPLGWNRDYPYTAVTVALEPNDTVTAFTDGVSRRWAPRGRCSATPRSPGA